MFYQFIGILIEIIARTLKGGRIFVRVCVLMVESKTACYGALRSRIVPYCYLMERHASRQKILKVIVTNGNYNLTSG